MKTQQFNENSQDTLTIQHLNPTIGRKNLKTLADQLYESKAEEYQNKNKIENLQQQITDLKDHVKMLTHININQQKSIDQISQLRTEKSFWQDLALSQQKIIDDTKAENLVSENMKLKFYIQKLLNNKQQD